MPPQPQPPEHQEPPDQRKTRQFSWLLELGHSTMTLARNASAAALREDEAEAAAKLPPPPAPTTRRRRDHRNDFCRLARIVRQIIAMEMELEAAQNRAPPPPPPAVRPPDPRRELFRRTFHETVANDPDRARLRREIDRCIDAHLAADPDHAISLPEHLCAIRNELHEKFGIDPDITRVPDELLGLPPRYPNPQAPNRARGSP